MTYPLMYQRFSSSLGRIAAGHCRQLAAAIVEPVASVFCFAVPEELIITHVLARILIEHKNEIFRGEFSLQLSSIFHVTNISRIDANLIRLKAHIPRRLLQIRHWIVNFKRQIRVEISQCAGFFLFLLRFGHFSRGRIVNAEICLLVFLLFCQMRKKIS